MRLLLVTGQVRRRGEGPLVGRVVGVVKVVFGVRHCLPGIDTGPVGAVVIRLQALPGGQLGIGDDEVQLNAPLVAVFDPQAVVLVGIEAGHQGALKIVHDGPLALVGHGLLGKAQNATGVPLGIPAGVDQLARLLRVAAQHRRPLPVAVAAQQVIRGA